MQPCSTGTHALRLKRRYPIICRFVIAPVNSTRASHPSGVRLLVDLTQITTTSIHPTPTLCLCTEYIGTPVNSRCDSMQRASWLPMPNPGIHHLLISVHEIPGGQPCAGMNPAARAAATQQTVTVHWDVALATTRAGWDVPPLPACSSDVPPFFLAMPAAIANQASAAPARFPQLLTHMPTFPGNQSAASVQWFLQLFTSAQRVRSAAEACFIVPLVNTLDLAPIQPDEVWQALSPYLALPTRVPTVLFRASAAAPSFDTGHALVSMAAHSSAPVVHISPDRIVLPDITASLAAQGAVAVSTTPGTPLVALCAAALAAREAELMDVVSALHAWPASAADIRLVCQPGQDVAAALCQQQADLTLPAWPASLALNASYVLVLPGADDEARVLPAALAAGAVPVIAPGTALPLSAAVPWKDCAIMWHRWDADGVLQLLAFLHGREPAERAQQSHACRAAFQAAMSSTQALAGSALREAASALTAHHESTWHQLEALPSLNSAGWSLPLIYAAQQLRADGTAAAAAASAQAPDNALALSGYHEVIALLSETWAPLKSPAPLSGLTAQDVGVLLARMQASSAQVAQVLGTSVLAQLGIPPGSAEAVLQGAVRHAQAALNEGRYEQATAWCMAWAGLLPVHVPTTMEQAAPAGSMPQAWQVWLRADVHAFLNHAPLFVPAFAVAAEALGYAGRWQEAASVAQSMVNLVLYTQSSGLSAVPLSDSGMQLHTVMSLLGTARCNENGHWLQLHALRTNTHQRYPALSSLAASSLPVSLIARSPQQLYSLAGPSAPESGLIHYTTRQILDALWAPNSSVAVPWTSVLMPPVTPLVLAQPGIPERLHSQGSDYVSASDVKSMYNEWNAIVPPHRIAIVTMCAYNASKTSITARSFANRVQYCTKHGYTCFLDTEPGTGSMHPAWGKVRLMHERLNNAVAQVQQFLPRAALVNATAEQMQQAAFDWVVWLDCDTFITNMDTPLQRFITTASAAWAVRGSPLHATRSALEATAVLTSAVFPSQARAARAWRGDGAAQQVRAQAKGNHDGQVESPAPRAAPDMMVSADAAAINTGAFFLRNTRWSRALMRRMLLAESWPGAKQGAQHPFNPHTWWEQAEWIAQTGLSAWGLDIAAHTAVVPQTWFNSYPRGTAHKISTPGGMPAHAVWQPRDFAIAYSGCNAFFQPHQCERAYQAAIAENPIDADLHLESP